MYVNSEFEILERLSNVESLFNPSIFCKIKCKEDIIVLGVIYRSPNSTPEDNDKLNNQIDFISNMLNASGDKLIMVGDFNYPDINWDQLTCDKPINHPAFKFLNTVLAILRQQDAKSRTQVGKRRYFGTTSRHDIYAI